MDATLTPGTGNVFADLGFENAAELQAKAMLSIHIEEALKECGWSFDRAAEATGMPETALEGIVRGDLDGFTIGQLMDCLSKLNRDIEIRVTRAKERGGRLTVVAGELK